MTQPTPNEPFQPQARGDLAAARFQAPARFGVAEAPKENASLGDVIAASWRQDNLIGAAIHAFGSRSYEREEGFNVFQHWSANRDEFKDMERFILDGSFDNVWSERDFLEKAANIRKQLEDKETLARGGFLGGVAQLAVGIADPTNFIPFIGTGSKLGRLGKAGVWAGNTAGSVAVQEAALHSMQDARTLQESAWAVGGAAVLGGGLGALVGVKGRGGRLHPDHPENPLFRDDPDPTATRVMRGGDGPDEHLVLSKDSIGAARKNADDLKLATSDNAFLAALQKIPEGIFDHWSPLARLWRWPSDVGREVVGMFIDKGGRLSRGNLEGRASLDVETLNAVDRQHLTDAVSQVDRLWREANIELGQSAAATGAKAALRNFAPGGLLDRNVLPLNDFKAGVVALGMAKAVNDVRVRGDLLQSLVRRGLDEKQAEAAVRKMEKAYDEVNAFQKRLKDRALKEGLLDPKHDLGDAYGMPILFRQQWIDANPDEARDFFIRMLSKEPPAEWLDTFIKERGIAHPKTGDEVEAKLLTVDELRGDTTRWSEALAEWSGEQEQLITEAAARNLEMTSKAYEKAKAELEVILYGQRVAEKEKAALSRSKLKAEVRNAESQYWARKLEATVSRLSKARERVEALKQAYPDLEDFADDVAAAFKAEGDKVDEALEAALKRRAEQRQKKAATSSLREDLRDLRKAKAGDEDIAAMQSQIAEALAEQKAATVAMREARAALNEAAGRSRNANSWLDAVTRRIQENKEDLDLLDSLDSATLQRTLDGEQGRLMELRAKLDEVSAKFAESVQVWKEVRAGAKMGRRSLREALKAKNKAERFSRKVEKAMPLHAYVDELVERLRGGKENIPEPVLLDRDATSGRLKERKLPWDPTSMREAQALGLIETDLFGMMNQYNRGLSGLVNMQRVAGTTDVEELVKRIRDDYQRYIDRHKAAGNNQAAAEMKRLRDKNIEDARRMINRALGREPSGGFTEANAARWADRLKTGVYIAAGGSFVFSALSDLSTAMLVSSGALVGLMTKGRALAKLAKLAAADDVGARELRSLLRSMEATAHLPAEGAFTSELTDITARGMGRMETMTAGDKFDAWMATAAERVNTVSGLALVTNRVRQAAALSLLDQMGRKFKDVSKMSKADMAKFASMGIGTADAKRLGKLFAKYGEERNGLFLPNLHKWRAEADGDYLIDVFESALTLAQRRASYVPGYGSVPLTMSTWWGRLLFQFQSYAFQFTHSFLLSGTQRLLSTGDLNFVAAFSGLLLFTTMTSAIRAVLRGEDPDTWDETKWAWEIVNRSGMLGQLAPYTDVAIKTFGDNVNEALGMKVFEPSSKFRQNEGLTGLAGPWLGYVNRPIKAANAIADGDTERGLETLATMIPLNQQFKALASLPKSFD